MSSGEQQRANKVLEDIQRAKSKLLKDGAAASLGIAYAQSSAPSGGSSFNNPGATPTFNSDVHMSPAQRSAMQVLQQANMTSFGYFVAQDSHFGNSILPVLPRIEPLTPVVPPVSPAAVTTAVKTEK